MKAKIKSLLHSIKKHLVVIATFSSVLLGIIVGSIIRATSKHPWTEREIMYLNFVGELFLRTLKSLILPLIATSLITAIASLNLTLSRKIGGRAVAFYLTTTSLSVVLGIAMVSWIRPGVGTEIEEDINTEFVTKKITTVDTLLDLLRNMCPPNIIQACLEQTSTVLTPPTNNSNTSGEL